MTLHEVNDACGDCWAEPREVTSTVAYRAGSSVTQLCYVLQVSTSPKATRTTLEMLLDTSCGV